MAECCDEGLAVVGDNFDKHAPLAEDVLEDPITEGLCGLFAEHAEFWVVGKQTAALDDIREPSRVWEVHSVHVHLGEEWGRHCDDRWDDNLSGLAELANVAHMYIPCNVTSNEGPPVLFSDEHVSGVKPMVSNVIVCHFHGSSPLSFEEDMLVSTLGVVLPEYSIVGEKASCIADDKGVLVVASGVQVH